ncbi:MAG: hypothetical protein RLP09_42655 [Sandaracinaceae bacterium]|jgi:hypothetical protein|nr:MAG: hypothetical protein EVA89_16820 [Sandaracinaceae bacterium]
MSRKHVDEEHLNITGRHRHSQPPGVAVEDDVIVVITQAFGPKGDNLVGLSDVTFDEHPAVTLKVRHGDREGLVHLSPIHGDKRKEGMTDFPVGTKLELLCPVSGEKLPQLEEIRDDDSNASYYAIWLSPKLDQGAYVAISDVWGHYHSRIVEDDELISHWTAQHSEL